MRQNIGDNTNFLTPFLNKFDHTLAMDIGSGQGIRWMFRLM